MNLTTIATTDHRSPVASVRRRTIRLDSFECAHEALTMALRVYGCVPWRWFERMGSIHVDHADVPALTELFVTYDPSADGRALTFLAQMAVAEGIGAGDVRLPREVDRAVLFALFLVEGWRFARGEITGPNRHELVGDVMGGLLAESRSTRASWIGANDLADWSKRPGGMPTRSRALRAVSMVGA